MVRRVTVESVAVGHEQRALASIPPLIAVIWIDWYAYHIARLKAIVDHPLLEHRAVGIELVGGTGVHHGLLFREKGRECLPITTLMDCGWSEAGQRRMARCLWTELDRLNPAVVFIPGYYTLPALAAAAWAQTRKRKPILMSESTEQDHPRKGYREAAKRALVPRLFDAAIAGGKRQKAYLRGLGFAEEKIGTGYDVVDNDYFARETAKWHARTRPDSLRLPNRYFLYVGRIAPEKNISGLIQEFKSYRKSGGAWSLVLVGDGPLASEIRQMVTEAGLSDFVHFAGLKDTRAIVPYYAFAQCLVLPSWREPWGLVVNEAMAGGLPIILSNRCGSADDLLEDGVNGHLFDPECEGNLAQAMRTMSGLDEIVRRRMGLRSQEIVSSYSPSLWAEEVVRIAGIKSVSYR